MYINNIHNNIKLNPRHEEHNSIDFLDSTTLCMQTKLEIDIYRKPTTTDTTINFFSNHPIEHKMAALRFHISRMHSLLLDMEKRQKEWEIIQSIAKTNNFPQGILQKLNQQIQHNARCTQTKEKDKKVWTTFTYHGPKIRKITNLFKNTNTGTTFETTILHQLIKTKTLDQTTGHEKVEYTKSYATIVRIHM